MPVADTAAQYAVARIRLWSHDVGAVAETPDGRVIIEYSKEFREGGLEISPIELPLSHRGPKEFRTGLPGLLADTLPGGFARRVLDRRADHERRLPPGASPVRELIHLADRTIGALEFAPPVETRQSPETGDALDFPTLVAEARAVADGDDGVGIPALSRVGVSAGGAAPKAVVLWHRGTHRIRSGFAAAAPGDEHWIVKLDGVVRPAPGDAPSRRDARRSAANIVEHVYAGMARAAGIDVAETQLWRERDLSHLMVRRFDRVAGGRLHVHTFAGLTGAGRTGADRSRLAELRLVRQLGMDQRSVDQLFRRMVFNVAAGNRNDGPDKSVFLMGPDGGWRLSPAFGLTCAPAAESAEPHGGRAELLSVGAEMDVPHAGARIIEEVREAVAGWDSAAWAAGAPTKLIRRVSESLPSLR